MCSCHPAPPSAIIPMTRATHSLHLTLFYSYKIMGPPTLSSHLLTHSKLMVLPLQVPCPHRPLPCSTISSQVPVCPIRNDTGDVMPLAQAITQLSFLEFLQHCGVPFAPPQPSQLPVPISLLDAGVQTTPPCDVSHQVSTQTSVQQDTLSCDVAVQTSSHGTHILSLDAAAQTTSPSTLSQHVSTQMGSPSFFC